MEHDYYATDPKSVEALLEVENFDNSNIYEPCCGEGHIIKTLKSNCDDIKIYASDLIDRGYGKPGIDFLTHNYNNWKCDNIITNPPYKYAKEFVDKSLQLVNNRVVMFLKIQFLEGQARKDWFKDTPLRCVYVFSKRQQPMRNGESVNPKTGKKWCSTMCFAWFVWEIGYTGEPVIRWI